MAIDVAAELPDRIYEGPFDLLLQLILAEEVDIYEVSLARIVDAYLAEIERMQQLDLDVATEFLLIAATLVELKARRLLPGRADVDLDDELALWEERDLLLARLLECKTFKDVSRLFGALADDADRSVPRRVGPDERFAGLAPDLLAGVTPLRLRDAAIVGARRHEPVPRIDLFHVAPIRASVADAVAELVDELPRVGRITFARLTADARRAARGDRPLPRRARAVQAGPGRARPGRALRRHPHRVVRRRRPRRGGRSPSTPTKVTDR